MGADRLETGNSDDWRAVRAQPQPDVHRRAGPVAGNGRTLRQPGCSGRFRNLDCGDAAADGQGGAGVGVSVRRYLPALQSPCPALARVAPASVSKHRR